MTMASTAHDVPLLIASENSSSERRITPSWTIAQLKARLEPITGVPASCQKLSLKVGSQTPQPIHAANEESTQLAAWPLQAYAEIYVGENTQVSSNFAIMPHCPMWQHVPNMSSRFILHFTICNCQQQTAIPHPMLCPSVCLSLAPHGLGFSTLALKTHGIKSSPNYLEHMFPRLDWKNHQIAEI